MAEDFRTLLDQFCQLEGKKTGKPTPVSPAAYAMADMMTQAFERYEQHVADLQATAQKAYDEAASLRKRLAEAFKVDV